MDMSVVNNMLAEIGQGHALLADPADATFNGWVVCGDDDSSMAP